jgi:hypothetical protein
MPAGGGDMDNKVTELPANRLMYDECIQDQEQWAQNVEMYMRGLPINA